MPIPREPGHRLDVFRSSEIALYLEWSVQGTALQSSFGHTRCHRLLHASGVFGPPINVDFSNTRLASFHTSGRNPLSGVRPVSLNLSNMFTSVSVSLSVQCADFFRSLMGEAAPVPVPLMDTVAILGF